MSQAYYDPVLHELLQFYGLGEYEESLARDQFGIDNLLQVKTESDFAGFFEHFDVHGFLYQNRFKTLIAAIPALKRTNRIPVMNPRLALTAPPSPAASSQEMAVKRFDRLESQLRSMETSRSMAAPAPALAPAMATPAAGFSQAYPAAAAPLQLAYANTPATPSRPAASPAVRAPKPSLAAPVAAVAAPVPASPVMPVAPLPAAPAPVPAPATLNSMAPAVQIIEEDEYEQTQADKYAALELEEQKKKEAAEAKANDPFGTEEASAAVEFGMVKPWIGTVESTRPDNAPANNPNAPDADLELEWIYGMRCQGVRNVVLMDGAERIVYPAASILVAYDPTPHTQAFFRGHNNDISCVAQHPGDPNIIATGQCASIVEKKSSDPFICVFDVSRNLVIQLPPAHKRNIGALGFSADGQYLASNGHDNDFLVKVWDWQNRQVLGSIGAANKVEINQLAWNSRVTTEFCGVGKNTVAFYQFNGRALTVKQGKFGKYERQMFICVAYSDKGTACVGAKDGSVYAFIGDECKRVFPGIHNSPVHTIIPFEGGVITGGTGAVVVSGSKMEALHTFQLGASSARSLAVRGSTLVIGTGQGELYRIRNFNTEQPQAELLLVSHHDGELWALCPHPDPRLPLLVSAGEDNKILVWDTKKHRLVKMAPITTDPPSAQRKVQRASTTSSHATNQMARSVAFSPDGRHIAVGTNEGKVAILDAGTLSLVHLVDLNRLGKPNNKNPEHWIEDLKYSPLGSILAVATHGSIIALLDVTKQYTPKERLTAHNAAVIQLDWSTDGRYLQSVCLAYELLFHDITPAIQGSTQHKHASTMKNVDWYSQTCKFGWPVNGIFRPDQSGYEINTVDRSNARDLLAIGDDDGRISLFRFPCNVQGNKCKQLEGHSSHIQRVRFSPSDDCLYSAGGNDKCIFQWRITR
eukprot:TRINITY_DN3687_c0_g1_i1.p1 TRINITY_DN3687_c0_g1~~TRINITY_DN3687_c0_g1_i1.p1  ORF type:complete len:923 (+),score=318.78 TRINITY_DN3687_c0_g1_i1:72-2840(+)